MAARGAYVAVGCACVGEGGWVRQKGVWDVWGVSQFSRSGGKLESLQMRSDGRGDEMAVWGRDVVEWNVWPARRIELIK